jgi:hypothetical protein
MANLNSKIDYWKNRLLDLGKRNRLVNCPVTQAAKSRQDAGRNS